MARPRVLTDEQRIANKAKTRAKTKNITLDADILDMLHDVQDRMEAKLGFRPTASQALRYMIKRYDEEGK